METTMNYVERDTYGMYRKDVITGPDMRRGPGPELMGAETLIGSDVYNKKGEDLGDIKEIMLDMRTGRVAYAVLAFGSFLGMGGKLFAVPWAALTLDTENKRFALDVEKTRLSSAPGFDKDKWPNMADAEWAKGIHSYYGTKPYEDRLNA
jgi:sporulation protein YlmC with PRC-barrel domain